MDKPTIKTINRLKGLDGLRGIAIILVMLNHIPLGIWYSSTPNWLHPFFDLILVNGKTGVSILFLLTGFLMAWLYPNPISASAFWAKRYARLFPAFLVMVVSWTIIKIQNNFSIPFVFGTIIAIAIFARLIWELILVISKKIAIKNWLLWLWLLCQIGVAGWYCFYLLKIPSPIFYQTWDKNLQWIITGLVNATLTLPFGNYIGQLDGVYWSLITEMFFYLLYPIILVPIFRCLNQKKGVGLKIILWISSIFFCYGLDEISKRVLGFQIMMPYLMIYFIAGVIIGSNLEKIKAGINQKFQKLFRSRNIGLLLFLSMIGAMIYPLVPRFYYPLIQMITLTSLSGLLISITVSSNKNWLGNKILVFLGKYSYSLYLTHAIVIDVFKNIISPASISNSIFLTTTVLAISISLSWIIYHLIELPYYQLPKVNLNNPEKNLSKKIEFNYNKTVFCLGLTVVLILYFSYRPPISLFTYSQPIYKNFFKPISNPENLLIESVRPVKFEIKGKSAGLGMLTSHIKNLQKDKNDNSVLTVKLLSENGDLISKSNFDPQVMIEDRYQAFGFPQQTDSKDKKYLVEYEITPKNSDSKMELIRDESDLLAVYFLDKSQIFKNPKLLIWWVFSKLVEPFLNPEFWLTGLKLMPMFFIFFWVVKDIKPKKKNIEYNF